MRKYLFALSVLLLLATAALAEPLSKQAVIDILHNPTLAANILSFIHDSGLAFPLTPDAETELRSAGLKDAQLRQIWTFQVWRAVETLRALNVSARTYRNTYGELPPTLATLGPPPIGQNISRNFSNLVNLPLQPLSYTFEYVRAPSGDSYTITARPSSSRVHPASLYTDAKGLVRVTLEDRAATASDPVFPTEQAAVVEGASILGDPHISGPTQITHGPPMTRSGIVPPRAIYSPDPQYPDDTKDRIEGVVVLSVVVAADGTVNNARVARSLRPDLDQRALRTVQDWRFQPAMKDGAPIAVPVNVEIHFRPTH